MQRQHHDRFSGKPRLPHAPGKAKVDSKQGSLVITADFKDLEPAQKFGSEYLTYVLGAISPEGKPGNVGVLDNVVRADTAGTIDQVKANYELPERGRYVYQFPQEARAFPPSISKFV